MSCDTALPRRWEEHDSPRNGSRFPEILAEGSHPWWVNRRTREGEVYHRLLTKLETISETFKGRVFDILGGVFEDKSLKDLLLDAIRYNDRPEVRAAELEMREREKEKSQEHKPDA